MNWEKFRRSDGTIDLVTAWMYEHKDKRFTKSVQFVTGETFLKLLQVYQPIKSRQVAALAMAQADMFLIDK